MEVPTISLAPYFEAQSEDGCTEPRGGDDSAGLANLVAEVRSACEEVGFFIVTDHGIEAQLLDKMRGECAAFFARPPQSTILGMVQGDESRFAWLDFVPPPGGGAGTSNSGAAWSLGPVTGRGSLTWQLDTETLRTVWTLYYSAMERLTRTIMSIFALALGLPADAFGAALKDHCSSMRAILYPEVSETDLQETQGEVIRSVEHTDWGCLTVLLPDPEVAGLEVCGKDGVWAPVRAAAGSLVVNLGDLLPVWTRGRWVATPHRVIARADSRGKRLSIPYFGLVNRGTLLEPLVHGIPNKSGLSEGEEDEELVITAGDFFDRHEEYATRWRRFASDTGATSAAKIETNG